MTLAPYPVSVPALQSYDAGSGPVTVDYASVTPESGAIPGVGPSDPIVLSNDGEITVTFWRPQRQAVSSTESGYYDWGNLNYGLIIGEAQATCAEYYSAVSSDLVEDTTPFGEGNSPLAQNGANLAPCRDSVADRAANSANTLTFRVNLKNCLARAGRSPGISQLSLDARGKQVTGGQITASKLFYVQIP